MKLRSSSKQRADIDDLLKEEMEEIENLKKLNEERDQECDALKKKLNEAQSTISKQRADIESLKKEKESYIKEIEDLKKVNKERNQNLKALRKRLDSFMSIITRQGADIDRLTQEKISNRKEIENLKKLNEEPELDESLISDFREQLTNGNEPDVVLKVQDKEFPAHRMVLGARSPVFRATFSHDSEEKKTGVVTIPDCDPESFSQFLSFLYSGRVGEELTVDTALQLYATSDKYDVPNLKSICHDHLKRNLTPESVCNVAALADLHSDDDLAAAAQVYFNENYIRILLTRHWKVTLEHNSHISDKLLKEMRSGTRKKQKTSLSCLD